MIEHLEALTVFFGERLAIRQPQQRAYLLIFCVKPSVLLVVSLEYICTLVMNP